VVAKVGSISVKESKILFKTELRLGTRKRYPLSLLLFMFVEDNLARAIR
jgi:hypothetical protein